MNKVILTGNVGRDPKIVENEYGKIMIFSLATDSFYRDKDGKRQKKTQWHLVHVYNKALIDGVGPYVKKGTPIEMEGELEYYKPDPDQNHTVAYVAVRFGHTFDLGARNKTDSEEPTRESYKASGDDTQPPPNTSNGPVADDEEIPF